MKRNGNILLKSAILVATICYAVPAVLALAGIKLLTEDTTNKSNESNDL